jgi:non-ribosomal peptide synthetase component E (peptide arylation enzyme)
MTHERVFDALNTALAQFADRTAVLDGDRVITYRNLDGLSAVFANQVLDAGVHPGERVLVAHLCLTD